MRFTDKLWVVCGWVAETAVKATADTMEVVGTLACMVGGTGFTASFAMNETLTTSYYGSANAEGNININIQVKQFDYTLNQTAPFQYISKKDGATTYTLTDYIQASTVRAASAICFASGTGLRILSANINKWQQSRADKNYYSDLKLARPTLNEHLYASANSLYSSFSYALFTSTITGSIISYFNPIGSKHNYTYPSNGAELVNTSSYEGPVNSILVPVEIKFNDKIWVQIPVWKLNVSVLENIDVLGTINASYAGEISFQSHDHENPPIAIPAVLGTGAYLAGNFFSKKINQLHNKRIEEANENKYAPVSMNNSTP